MLRQMKRNGFGWTRGNIKASRGCILQGLVYVLAVILNDRFIQPKNCRQLLTLLNHKTKGYCRTTLSQAKRRRHLDDERSVFLNESGTILKAANLHKLS